MKFWLQVLLFIPLSIFAVKNTRVPNELIIQTSSIDQVLSDLKSEFQFVATSKCISQHNQLYVLSFRTPATINENHLKLVRSIKGVEVAQFNHLLEERATPNDPDFGVQWYHNNTGQTGGSIGADIHSTEAWDITTGGISSIGDTIVICVVESNGVNINHPELTENIWVNHQEIPDNGIDDDGNGFIDDYYGWRINTQNDDHLPGGHGTGVSGVIGAKGNNNQLIAGVNWNVKIMVVSGFSALVESQVVQGYDYALSNRMLYESSHGTKGAFVVATNSSFGLSGLGPSDAPLWCAMYDTLGKYGILSTGATANSGINVDIDGDLPTTCPSDYLIAVTASDHNDQVNGYGYGPINIDLASPGEGITVLNSTSGITTSNGTSFATPMVTGGIGLAYSISCTDLATLAHNLELEIPQ